MKKASAIIFMLFLGIAFNGQSQSFTFEGQWDMVIVGTPDGDAKLVLNLERKDGNLTGEISDATGKIPDKIPVTKLEESPDKLVIYFTIQGYDVSVSFTKVDDDNLKGNLMEMFDVKAVRIKK